VPVLQPGWRPPPARSADCGRAATRYDLIAREGTVDRARTMLRTAGLLPDQTEPTLP
jgi:hypothetical protein